MVQNVQLSDRIQNLENRVSNNYASLRNDVQNISSNVYDAVTQANELVTDYSWSYGEVDVAQRTVPVTFSVTLREYSPTSRVALQCGGADLPLALENGAFVATTDLPLLAVTEIPRLTVQTGDTIQTESLYWGLAPYSDALPSLYANLTGSCTYNAKTGILSLYGAVDAELSGLWLDTVRSVDLVARANGNEIYRTALAPGFSDANLAASQAQPVAEAEPITSGESAPVYSQANYFCNLPEALTLGANQTLKLTVDAALSNGLVLRSEVYRTEIDAQGAETDSEWVGGDAVIYDAQGTLLYNPNR